MNKRITLPFFSLWLTGKAYKDSGLSIKGGLMPVIKDDELDYVSESGWATYIISLVGPDDRPLGYKHFRLEFATIPTDKPFYLIFMAEDQILKHKRLLVKSKPAPAQLYGPIPEGCTHIYLPSSVDIVREFYNDPVIDASDQFVDVEMFEHVFRRDKTSGVISDVSFPMEFVKKAAAFIKSKFEQDGLYAEMQCLFYQRGKRDNNYTLIKKSTLNFETYKEYNNMVTIESNDEDLTVLINSEGKTKYEILVDEVKDSKVWDYQRIDLVSYGLFDGIGETELGINKVLTPVPLVLQKSEFATGAGIGMIGQNVGEGQDTYFFTSLLKDITISLSASLGFVIETNVSDGSGGGTESEIRKNVTLYLRALSDSGYRDIGMYAPTKVDNIQISNPQRWRASYTFHFQENMDIEVKKGERLQLVLIIRRGEATSGTFSMTEFENFDINFSSISFNPVNIDVVDPLRLIQKYLDEMSGVPRSFRASIEWEEKDYRTMIVAAESIRQIPGAKLYGSPNDFFDWMKVLGYEYECIDRNLVFKSRDKFFDRNVTAMSLKAEELADLIVQADNTYAYTTVEIGYDKKDYDSLNGRCEPNGKYCYTTGLLAKADNKLSLVSPYRADSIGIEYLCQEVDEDSTDTKSDNDIFFVALEDNGNSYTEYRDEIIKDSVYGVELFNAPFNPYFLVKRNESLIGINAKEVKFKSTDMSRTAEIIKGAYIIDPYVNQAISKGLFSPIEYNFAAGFDQDLPAPALRNGLVKFVWKKEILQGFIKEVRKNPHAPTETTWLLWAAR